MKTREHRWEQVPYNDAWVCANCGKKVGGRELSQIVHSELLALLPPGERLSLPEACTALVGPTCRSAPKR